ncbi:hypothetical protein IR117_03570, partial [Streptococcus danieliae]|nr:hypothetical protein [Streptococcus danieliae]
PNQIAVIQAKEGKQIQRVRLDKQVFETVEGSSNATFPGLANTLAGMVFVLPNDDVLSAFQKFYNLPLSYRVFADISKAEINAVA